MTQTITNINSANAGANLGNGTVWLEGSGAPAPSLGNNNDFYLNGTTGDVYVKTNSAWSLTTNIRGPSSNATSVTWQTKTTNYTAANGDYLFVDTTNTAITITLPSSPAIGYAVTFEDPKGTWPTNNVTVSSPDSTINYTSGPLSLNVSDGVTLLFTGSSWVATAGGFGSAGPTGATGAQGPAGSAGAQGTPGAMVQLATMTANNSSEIVFTNIPGSYTYHQLVLTNVSSQTSDQFLYIRYSTNNGTSFDTNGDYKWLYSVSPYNANPYNSGNAGDSVINIGQLPNVSEEPASGFVYFYGLGGSSTKGTYSSTMGKGAGDYQAFNGSSVTALGASISTAPVNAIQFFAQNGNIATGTFTLYGIT